MLQRFASWEGGRGGGKTRFSDLTVSDSYPGAVVVSDDLRLKFYYNSAHFLSGDLL